LGLAKIRETSVPHHSPGKYALAGTGSPPASPSRVPRFHFCNKLFTKGYWRLLEQKSVWREKDGNELRKPAEQSYIKSGGFIWIRQLHFDAATEHRSHTSARRDGSQGEK
jgi:hypothetical protein